MPGRLTSFVVLGMLVIVVGCDSGPKIVPVSGTATRGGQPVPNVLITFQPEKGRPSAGVTDGAGRFTLDYDAQNKGALVGKHTVSVANYGDTPDSVSGKVKPHPAMKEILTKYGDTVNSPLKLEITGATDNIEVKLD